ncbi:hypothetical protein [Hydrogenimonas sp.]
MDYLARMKVFVKLFPDSTMDEMAAADFIFSAANVARDAVMHDGRRYIVVTAKMLGEGVALFRGSERKAQRMLSKMVDHGMIERIKADRRSGTKFAYFVSDRYMMTLHATPENFSLPGYSDWENLGKIKPTPVTTQADTSDDSKPTPVSTPSYYNKNNIYIDTQADKNVDSTSKNLPETSSHSPTSSSKKHTIPKEIIDAFERYWAIYPKHKKKQDALKRFANLKLHRQIDELLTAVRNYCSDEGIRRNLLEGHLEYVKNPDTFLLTRGVEYWRDWIGGGAVLNRAAISAANGGESDGGVEAADDQNVADFVGRMERAFAKLGDERDPEASLADTVGEFFSEEEISVMEAENWRVPFVYEEYTKERYARFIIDKLREGGSHDGAA